MKRDFSESAYNSIVASMKQVVGSGETGEAGATGDSGSSEETGLAAYSSLMDELGITTYINNAQAYTDLVIQKNNEAIETLGKVFEAAREIDQSYALRLAAYLTMATEFQSLLDSFSGIIAPANGIFEPEKLDAFIKEYEEKIKVLDEFATEDISKETIEKLENNECVEVLNEFMQNWIKYLPDFTVGGTVEVPIAPGVVVYASVTSSHNGMLPINLDYAVDEQKCKLAGLSIKGETDDSSGEISIGENGEVTIKSSAFDMESSLSDGTPGVSFSTEVGNDTYKVSLSANSQEIKYEQSIETNFTEEDSLTTACGIKITHNDSENWGTVPVLEPVPVPAVVPVPDVVETPEPVIAEGSGLEGIREPISMPSFHVSDESVQVAETVFWTTAAVVTIELIIFFTTGIPAFVPV